MGIFRRALLAPLVAALVSPALGAGFDFDQGVDAAQALRAAREGASSAAGPAGEGVRPKEVADWTVMYYINAKNNLVSYVDPDLNHMEEVGSSGKLKIVAEVGRLGGGVKRYLMHKDDSTGTVTSAVVADMGNADMGDWKHLAEFGKWVKANYPAKRYMLSIWNHGSGWTQGRPPAGNFRNKGISYDDESGNHLSTTDLAQALAAMGGVDIYASDACLMQMAEVGYELREHAGVVLGSEENEPAVGWNYAYYLGPLAAAPQMTPEQLSQTYVEAFRRSYAESGHNTTHSAVATAAYRDFVPVLGAWTSAVRGAGEGDLVRSAREKAQSFSGDRDNIDLLSFVGHLNATTRSAGVKSSGEAVLRYVRERLVLANAVTGDGLAGSAGLSIYLPTGPVSEEYAQLAWARESGWPAFASWVSSLHQAARK